MGIKLPKIGALGAVAPMVAGGVADYASAREQARAQEKANATNVYLAGAEMDFNRAEAEKSRDFSAMWARNQMEFQANMSNTAHQREVEDLRKAGLNPILSANGGASSPGGAAPSAPMASGTHATVSAVPSVMMNMISGARDMIRTYADVKGALASARAAEAQALASTATAKKTGVETKVLERRMPRVDLEYKFNKLIYDIVERIGNSSAWSAIKLWSLKDFNWLD